jgi:hypothetical protein
LYCLFVIEAGSRYVQVAGVVAGAGEEDAIAVRPLLPWLADWLADNARALMYQAPQAAAELLRAMLDELR